MPRLVETLDRILDKDVNLTTGQLAVNQGLVRVTGKGLIFQEPKTKLSQRVISLGPAVQAILREHKKKQAEYRLLAGGGHNKALDQVFANEIGEPTDTRAFTRVFERLTKKENMDVHFHGLRHTFATIALEAGR